MKIFNKAAAVSSVMFAMTVFGSSIVFAANTGDVTFSGNVSESCSLTVTNPSGSFNEISSTELNGVGGEVSVISNAEVIVSSSMSSSSSPSGGNATFTAYVGDGTASETVSASATGESVLVGVTVNTADPFLLAGNYTATVTLTCIPSSQF